MSEFYYANLNARAASPAAETECKQTRVKLNDVPIFSQEPFGLEIKGIMIRLGIMSHLPVNIEGKMVQVRRRKKSHQTLGMTIAPLGIWYPM